MAEQFKRTNPQLRGPIVESTGTGGGIKLFCSGVGERFPHVANASRRMKLSFVRMLPVPGGQARRLLRDR